MKKALIVVPMILLTVACSRDPSTVVIDDAGHAHYTKSMIWDTKGSMAFPSEIAPTGKRVFIFDPRATAWAVYDVDGRRMRTGSASGGKDFCEDIGRSCRTVTGTFRIYSKKGEDCRSSIYPVETGGGGKMPYCMHFNGGYSIHAAYEVPNYNTSHGCIRVLPSAAKWLHENLNVGSTVIVRPY